MKSIPVLLQDSRNTGMTAECYLLRIEGRSGAVLGVTTHSSDITYNDGSGDVEYKASMGQTQSNIHASAGTAVDNSEAKILLADSGEFTEEEIQAGAFDFGTYDLYRINWLNPGWGHEHIDRGTTGRITIQEGLAGIVELRSLHQMLRQTFVEPYSLTCRAKAGALGDHACNFDFSSLWQSHTVTAVDSDESDRIFTLDSAPAVNGPNGALDFVPGIVKFTSGDNIGIECEIAVLDGDEVQLRFEAPKSVAVSDTLDIRPDCAKRFIADCKDRFDNVEWFRGEPLIPLGDQGKNVTPGANTSRVWSYQLLPEAEVGDA